MNKKLLATIIALGVFVSIGYFGVSYAIADDEGRPHEVLITRIAEKFNLKEEDVEAVFTAVQDERQAEMKAKREERLNQAVSDGVITEVQKATLLTKMQEHMGERQQNREEMQAWFTEQGIDETKLRSYLGFGGPEGKMGRGMGPGPERPQE